MKTETLNGIMENTKVVDGNLSKDGKLILSVGDKFVEKLNDYREYECKSIDLHYIKMLKTKVGQFEKDELGKHQELQTAHFLADCLELKKIN